MRRTAFLVIAGLIIAGLWACSDNEQAPPAAPEEPLEYIDSVIPADGAYNVSLASAVQVTFLRPMDTASLTADKFYLNGGGGYTFTRDSLRATLYPFGNLRPDYPYEAIVRAGVRDRDGNALPSDYSWSFHTGFGSSLIDGVYPPSGAEDAPVDSPLYVVFDHRMNETTIDESSFTVPGITGQVSYSNNTAWFEPDEELAHDQEYTAVLAATVADTAGTLLGSSFSWSFTTNSNDSVPPAVVSVFPAAGAVDIPLESSIKITFSENVNSAPPSNWTLTVSDGITGLVESVSRDIILQPDEDLDLNHTYTVTFAGTIYDYFGNSLDTTVVWSFTTLPTFAVIATTPEDGAAGVSPLSAIAATFTGAVDPAGVTGTTFSVYSINDSEYLSGLYSFDDTMVIFAPAQSLKIGRHIRATATTGITSMAGDSLAADYSWTFIVEPGVLMPLAIGNKWVYDVNGTATDSIVIVSDTLISDTLWYRDQNGKRYQNFPEKFITSNHFLMPPMIWSIDYPSPPKPFSTVTVPAGVFSAMGTVMNFNPQRFEFSFAPDTGMLTARMYINTGSDIWDLVSSRELIRVELQGP